MDTIKASKIPWKHVICCLIILVIFVLTIGIHINAEGFSDDAIADSSSDTVPLRTYSTIIDLSPLSKKNEVNLAGPKEEVTVEEFNIDSYITTYSADIELLSKAFGLNYDKVINNLKITYEKNLDKEFDKTNVGFLLNADGNVKKYKNVLYGLVEYFYDYVEKYPKEVNKKRIPYTGNAEYIENLIIYYTRQIYTNVDTSLALSIGASESGYYKVKYMLRCNNVFGGMGKNGLIKYNNIEFGVLSYVRMLSTKYYQKGLTSIESIGRKYCPTYDSFGNKIASPHWVKLVQTAMKKYNNYEQVIGANLLLNKEEIA